MLNKEFYEALQNEYHIENDETVIKIPFENITEVGRNHIYYKNLSGDFEKIDLDACVNNFCLAINKELKNQSGEPIKAVGGRCFLSSQKEAFYEFFTADRHIRFCMPLKQTAFKKFLRRIGWNTYSEAFSRFYSLQEKLNFFGYSAIDLT